MRRALKWGLIPVLLGLIIWTRMSLLSGQKSAAQQTGNFTRVVTVVRGNLVAYVMTTGEVYAPRSVKLSFDVTRAQLIKLNVSPGQYVKAGQVLACIDPTSLQRAVDQAKAELLSAEKALEKARNPYTDLDKRKAELGVIQAEVALEEAKQKLQELLNPDIAEAEKAVQEASLQLEQAKNKLIALQNDKSVQEQIDYLQWKANETEAEHGRLLNDYLNHPYEKERDAERLAYNRMMEAKDKLETAKAQAALEVLTAQAEVLKAEKALKEAQENLAKLKAGPDPLELAKARHEMAQAEYELAKAKEELAKINAGPDPREVELAEARYKAAKVAYEEALEKLESAVMVAPFDGTVISVGAQAGDMVSTGMVVVTLADLSELRVMAMVDETDIRWVEVGQEVEISFDAFPGKIFKGKVLEVPLHGEIVQNVVKYEVPVSLEGVNGVGIKPGMTANVKILVGKRENVLLVPVLALQQGETGYVVRVQDRMRGVVEVVPVEVGLSDGVYVEVLRGLNEGDQVLVEYQASQQQTSSPVFQFFGPAVPGGGPPPEAPRRNP